MRTGPAALLSQLVHHAMSAPGGGGEAFALQVAAQCTPPAFAHICPHIFRCADPTAQSGSFAFLETLGLRSVVLLSIEYPSTALEQFCAKNHAELHHFGIERRWPTPNVIGLREAYGAPSKASSLFLSSHEINSFSVLESIVKDALQLLLDVRNHPVLVTDTYVPLLTQCGHFRDGHAAGLPAQDAGLELFEHPRRSTLPV